ncbi:MAG: hypothetical protein ACI8X3_001371, partial [Saprospiraceae bacterium]
MAHKIGFNAFELQASDRFTCDWATP